MNSTEKEINYQSYNSYDTLNTLTDKTKNIWFVCHGMGYLSRYFIRHFKHLNTTENYIIAPQAPSKYYQPKMHVGANWLTRDNTNQGMRNIVNYFDAIFENEKIPARLNLIVLGYSQGVSVALRYLALKNMQCQKLIIHSGGIPKELVFDDFEYLNLNTEVHLVYGTEDEYLDQERIIEETQMASNLFGNRLIINPFKGKHIVNEKFIKSLE